MFYFFVLQQPIHLIDTFERTSSNLSSCSACFVIFLTLNFLLPKCHAPSIHPHLFSLLIFLCVCVSGVLLPLCLCLCPCVAWTCLSWPRLPRRSFKRWVFMMQISKLASFSRALTDCAGTGSRASAWSRTTFDIFTTFQLEKLPRGLWSDLKACFVSIILLPWKHLK